MKVPHREGVANHTDPLSCVGDREVSGEALARAAIAAAGDTLSRKIYYRFDAQTPELGAVA